MIIQKCSRYRGGIVVRKLLSGESEGGGGKDWSTRDT